MLCDTVPSAAVDIATRSGEEKLLSSTRRDAGLQSFGVCGLAGHIMGKPLMNQLSNRNYVAQEGVPAHSAGDRR